VPTSKGGEGSGRVGSGWVGEGRREGREEGVGREGGIKNASLALGGMDATECEFITWVWD